MKNTASIELLYLELQQKTFNFKKWQSSLNYKHLLEEKFEEKKKNCLQ